MEAGMECPFRGPPGLRLDVSGLLPYPQARPSRCPVSRRSGWPSCFSPAPSLLSPLLSSPERSEHHPSPPPLVSQSIGRSVDRFLHFRLLFFPRGLWAVAYDTLMSTTQEVFG